VCLCFQENKKVLCLKRKRLRERARNKQIIKVGLISLFICFKVVSVALPNLGSSDSRALGDR
jgi:hypothetical protein